MIRITPASVVRPHHLPWVVLGTVALLLALAFGVARPLRLERDAMIARTAALNEQMANDERAGEGLSLAERLTREKRAHTRLTEEWEQQTQHIRTFPDGALLTQVLSTTIEGRIDFKVALFEARQRLGQKAAERGVRLPPDLGIPDTIGADEDAELRLGQLAATVRILEHLIHLNVPSIEHVRALPPEILAVKDSRYRSVVFYPVRVRLLCSHEQLTKTLQTLSEGQPFFSLRRVHAMSLFPDEIDELMVRAEWGAVVFVSADAGRERRWEPEETDVDWLFDTGEEP